MKIRSKAIWELQMGLADSDLSAYTVEKEQQQWRGLETLITVSIYFWDIVLGFVISH